MVITSFKAQTTKTKVIRNAVKMKSISTSISTNTGRIASM